MAPFAVENVAQAAPARPAISALDQAMAATLAAISVPSPLNGIISFYLSEWSTKLIPIIVIEDSMDAKPSPSSDSRTSTPEPRAVFKDKKEALEAFKELLKEKVAGYSNEVIIVFV